LEILRFDAGAAEPIGARPYPVARASSVKLAEGAGEAHVSVVFLEAGGEIGPHEAGFAQILFAASGSGWVAGNDGVRFTLSEGDAAFIHRGETHSKGSETGLKALMIQVRDLTPLGS
jgi:quercetin dioxygenase-like cupin family protein